MKVIIVGAGLAGLTLALACQKSSLDVTIYDKAKKLRAIGGGVVLWPPGLRYLNWLNLSHLLTPFKIPIEKCLIISHDGQQIFCEDYKAFYELINGSILPIDRSRFQNTLLSALKPNTLQFGKACVKVESNETCATVYFQDGTEQSADLVIGADGIHSMVRKSFNTHVKPQYTNYCWWGGIIKQKYLPHLSPENVHLALGHQKMCVIWPAYGKQFMWYLPVKMPEDDLKQPAFAKKKLEVLFHHWQPELQPLIHQSINHKKFYLPIFAMQPGETWTHHRIGLIGDAAHALGPVLGQGISQAIEDVYVLINCLQKEPNNIISMLKRYEAIRRPRCEKMNHLENFAAQVLVQDNLSELELFQQQLPHMTLSLMYQDLIPLIDEQSSIELAKLCLN